MRIVSFDGGFGRIDGDDIVPLGKDVLEFLRNGRTRERRGLPLRGVRLLAPVPVPGKILCIGLNYRDHAAEGNIAVPDEPPLFGKWANSVVGPDAVVVVPPVTREADYEAELGVVIGVPAHDVEPEQALEYVAGYTCLNDVSARDLQVANAQWTRGKAIDTFLPMGPWLVTRDEVADPQALAIRCRLNGELVQSSTTAHMVWTVAELVSFLSRTMTLDPGDVIATGTPAGVGAAGDPPRFLRDGDVVEVEIDGIGVLRNRVSVP